MISNDLKTTILGIIGALTLLAKAKGWIDENVALCIGSVLALGLGYYTNKSDFSIQSDDIGLPKPKGQ